MVHIASVIANRAAKTSATFSDIVSAKHKGNKQFDAYGKAMPAGTRGLVSLAERAMALVQQNGPITPATYYATPTARNGLPPHLQDVTRTKGHVYAVDPLDRAIGVGTGFIKPGAVNLPNQGPIPASRPTETVRRPSVDVAPNPSSFRVAHSRQFMPPERQMPMGDVRASLARAPGPGMAALAPHGILGENTTISPGRISFNHPDQTGISPNLAGVLGGLSSELGKNIQVTSGYRNPAYNKAVGGVRGSLHQKGLAADIDMSGMSIEERQRVVRELTQRNVGGFITYSKDPNMMHVDMRTPPGGTPHFMFDKTAAKMASAPGWFQEAAAYQGLKPPSNVPTPTSRPASPAYETSQRQALAAALEKAGIRGLGATSQVAPVGQVTRQSLPPDRQMPYGTPARQALAPDRPMPTARPNLSAALEKRGITSSAPSEALAPDRQMPTGPVRPNLSAALEKAKISTVNDSQPAKVDVSKTRVNPVTGEVQPGLNPLGPIQAYPSVSTVAPTNVAPIRTTLTPTGQIATRPKATPSVASQPIGAIPSQPISPVTQQPRVVQPVQPRIVQPVQTPPVNVPALPNALSQQDFNSRYASPTPGLRPSDVYGGAIGSAYSTGGNIVSRENSYGPTTVTNKYGVTTATMPDGKQAAYGKGPNLSGLTGAARPAIGGLAGGALGSLVGGPVGGIIGGLLGRQVASGQTQQAGTTGGLGGLLGGLFGGNQGNSSAKGSSKSSSGGSSKSSAGGSSRENNKPGGGRSTRYN